MAYLTDTTWVGESLRDNVLHFATRLSYDRPTHNSSNRELKGVGKTSGLAFKGTYLSQCSGTTDSIAGLWE